MERSTIFNGKLFLWPFSIAMLVHQRVLQFRSDERRWNETRGDDIYNVMECHEKEQVDEKMRWDNTNKGWEKKSYVMTWNWTSEGKMRCGECGKSWNGIEMRKITSNLYIMRLGFFKMFFLHPERRKWLMQSFVPCCLQIISNCL